MTTEEKAKAYDEALEWMREIYPTMEGFVKEDAEHYFPELKESEDERIREAIVELVEWVKAQQIHTDHSDNGIKWDEMLTYLEKQKEPKHDATDAKSEQVIKAARRVLNNWLDGTDCPDVSGAFVELEYAIRKYDGDEVQKEQKPTEWSDKLDTDTLRDWSMRFAPDIREEIEATAYHFYNLGSQPKQEWSEEDGMLMDELESYILYDKELNDEQKSWRIKRLKSLRPHWKPSEEQRLIKNR